jgi:hypothetical protein
MAASGIAALPRWGGALCSLAHGIEKPVLKLSTGEPTIPLRRESYEARRLVIISGRRDLPPIVLVARDSARNLRKSIRIYS